ncbi:MAG TPA: LLM class flavin-dependent oxidoreductase [Dermatophilaceae bacterium]|nr:LLM class flavin-dependent oxidoreductase [Dermatophilaceae bacterium]
MPDYGHDLSFGAFIVPSSAAPQQVVRLAQASEAAGLDLVTFQDHPYQPRFLEAWTLLCYVAAATSRVHLSLNVANLPMRPPGVLARAAASLDLLSGGRVAMALGAGAFADAAVAMGAPRREPGEAVDALAEAITVLRTLWDTGDRSAVRIEGDHYRLVGAKRGPAPAHRIPVWLGALKPRMLRLVGQVADGWLPSLSYLGVDALARSNAVIDEAAIAAGREPGLVTRLLNVGLDDADPRFLADLALEHGTSVFILASDDEATLTAYGQETAPAVRELVTAGRH